MKRLSHNGVMVSGYEPNGFQIKFRGKTIELTLEQEEMAVAWVKKLGTPYVEDRVFAKNFFSDLRKTLGIKEKAGREHFDFSEIERSIEKEREKKLSMTKEEKKALATHRKAVREANKERHGYAEVDGERVEVSNYIVEPSSIFMGRGKHPLRGRWKEGAKQGDITLNLSPDSKIPAGKWKKIIWEPDYMWVARWDDKLIGKKKYVWISENSYMRQKKEIDKFDKAKELEKRYDDIKKHIIDNLRSENHARKKVATVCYLIEKLSIRVGDEKDEDEADTIGATTLTQKNIKISPGNVVEFDFVGKDFVRLKTEVKLPEQVVENLKEFISNAANPNSSIFNGVRSESVSLFLDEVAPGMSAKVFRTFHSTNAVEDYLKKADAKKTETGSDAQKKHIAKMANLQAAIICNHKRTIPKSWAASLQRKKDRLKVRKAKSREMLKKLRQKEDEWAQKYAERLATYEQRLQKDKTPKQRKKTKEMTNRLKAKHKERMMRMRVRIEKRKQSDKAYIEKLKLQIEEQEATRDYNLNTSLKSYIDPRVYKKWFDKVDFDWTKYYSKTLQQKFSWVEKKN